MRFVNVVNANENIHTRRLYSKRDKDGRSGEHLMKHIPLARLLIEKYCQEPWKHSQNNFHYAFREYQLCSMIEDSAKYSKNDFLVLLAILLGCSPVLLHNDAELPFNE